MGNSEFTSRVDYRLETDSNEVFGNFPAENARYTISAFVKIASDSVEILSGSMPDGFYGDNAGNIRRSVFEALKQAIRQISKSRVINCNLDESVYPPIRIVTLDRTPNVELLHFQNSIIEEISNVIDVVQSWRPSCSRGNQRRTRQ